ncbi:GvpL/GvpF family gas vesicle protein [Georgenia thermotolerans]|uniref:Gas vesicle synthesis GvpLGvpF n=1 Tax=Georgenia thermotolerans TaxID=527326 RepID=A0A7J5UNG9_9MICO|nr:GvpL/GvpF family gas vesicle protein [Georgenia thermotolerans]KAE8763909.1 gas vesicle synthesis GvpLGvpF [Georgenia thermotolerans]
MTAAAPETGELSQYVYGIVPPDTPVPDVAGVGGGRVRLRPLGDVAALVSGVADPEVVGLPAEVRAHAAVLDAVAQAGPVLPMRFGTVVPDVDDLREALAADGVARLREDLARLGDAVQYTLTVRYRQEAVIAELVEEQPEIRRLREATAGAAPDAAYYERIRLGELVVNGFEQKRLGDAAALTEALGPVVLDLRSRETGQVEDVLEAAVLVRRGEQRRFDDTVEALASRRVDRMTFRLVGPQAPYDFVTEA